MAFILDHYLVFMGIAALLGLLMTWGIGANDVANAIGTTIGSGGVTVNQILIIAVIFEFLGAVLAGSHVTSTIQKKIIHLESVMDRPEILVFGMLSALLAASIWIMITSFYGWPVSITHTVIGAIVGFGLIGIGFSAIQWDVLGHILMGWIFSPLLGCMLAMGFMGFINKAILKQENPTERARQYAPYLVFVLGFPMTMLAFFKGLGIFNFQMTVFETIAFALSTNFIGTMIARHLVHAIVLEDYQEHDLQCSNVEIIFSPLMMFAAAAITFSHGANDVANGMGPIALVASVMQSEGNISILLTEETNIPAWILILGGIGIIGGLLTMGSRVIRTIGRKITELSPTRGFCATLATAITVIMATRIGLPVDTAQIAVGSVVGVGMYRSLDSVDFKTVGGIVLTWMVTFPASLVLSAMVYLMATGLLSKFKIFL